MIVSGMIPERGTAKINRIIKQGEGKLGLPLIKPELRR
jgi:hypothetical protein